MERSLLKKAIIFDCDNTLWRGVIGEEEVIMDSDIQQDIVFLANRGVIIGLCSKNNEKDVLDALSDQIFKEEFISVKRINWKDKDENLREIAYELNIGLDSIVFVDDSPFEIGLIKEKLPEVLAIYPKDLMSVANDWFDLSGDFTKTKQYKEQYNRVKALEMFSDNRSYLSSLDMILDIRINDVKNIKRITELTQKTNQFNLTTKRLTEHEMDDLMFKAKVYSLSVRDIYGDSGITGVCIVSFNTIDVFLLSCRILGRGIEHAFLDWVMADLKKKGQRYIFGRYIPSPKNVQTESFYKDCGFEYCGTYKDTINYYIELDDYKPQAFNHFKYD